MKGQALLETTLAVVFLVTIFFGLFALSRRVTAQTLMDHAAARAARARSVGLNKFMCRKAARVAMIPVAGRMLWPGGSSDADEVSRAAIYMVAGNEGVANGVLDYENWHKLDFDYGDGGDETRTRIAIPYAGKTMTGEADIEAHWPTYMDNAGR